MQFEQVVNIHFSSRMSFKSKTAERKEVIQQREVQNGIFLRQKVSLKIRSNQLILESKRGLQLL